jgi:DHA1 family bicyclomycin/chloramphenicol resistance-like MFS transporter
MTPRFFGYAAGGALATTSWYAFVGAAPAIFANGIAGTPRGTGICMGVIVSGLWIGTAVGWRWAGRATTEKLLINGGLLSLLAAMLFITAVAITDSKVFVTASMFLLTVGIGIVGPAALTGALSADDQMIGSASGLYGFMQMATGALCAAAVTMGSNPGMSAGSIMLIAAIIAQLFFFLARRAAPR